LVKQILRISLMIDPSHSLCKHFLSLLAQKQDTLAMRRNQACTLSNLALLAMTFILLQSNYSISFGQYRNQSQQQDTNTINITTTAAEDPSVNIRKRHFNH
jgi:hypothetical protein